MYSNQIFSYAHHYYCEHINRRVVTSQSSCKIAVLEHDFSKIGETFDFSPEQRTEAAFNLNTRQVALFSTDAEIPINCVNGNLSAVDYSYEIDGLVLVSLTMETDCTAPTKIHTWRSFPIMEETYDSRVIRVDLDASTLLGETNQRLSKLLKERYPTMKNVDDNFKDSDRQLKLATTHKPNTARSAPVRSNLFTKSA